MLNSRKVKVKFMEEKNIFDEVIGKIEVMEKESSHPVLRGFAHGWDMYARILGHTILALGVIRIVGIGLFKKDIFKALSNKNM